MNISFKILWFEDEVDWYNMERMRIVEILDQHYLQPDIIRKDGVDIDPSDLTANEYDLILMDYKLAEGMTGDIIVSELRNHNILTDIMFYSSQEQEMITAIRSKIPPIDGFYLTKRDYTVFTEKATRIIQKIVKRSEDVVNLRGFVLDNTSEFEVRIREIINICWQKFDENQKNQLLQKLSEVLDGQVSWTRKKVEKAKAAEHCFISANNDDYLLSISDRLIVFESILQILTESYSLPSNDCFQNFKGYYSDMINVYRNKLGHIKLGEKTIQINGKNVEINQNLHRLLRRNIFELDSKIRSVEEHITCKM